ncbi:hypothetical protein OSC27_06570 [Microbacterium sp. STN6]|uniref:hypothetical protein n=1 Tax=Microbacterium sp. STN6 TaxID=2995588 RepID=UPI002260FD0F|nr:hypothetical protein [Microbacterium sp. STN6]MCX7521943.1 hypothetical protein [Microbacterium sp. STN6]
MELMFVVLGGAIIGLAARYFLPGRNTHGSVLVPALGAAVAAVFWEALTWLGMKWDGGWIWWITLLATALVTFAVDLGLVMSRRRWDQERLATLTKTGVAARD